MPPVPSLGRISVDYRIMGGVPCVAGTRIPVATVAGSEANGLTTDEILAEHPQLTREDVQACLAYAARAVDVRELPVQAAAALIHELVAEASAPLPEDSGLTTQRAEELIAEIRADRDARWSKECTELSTAAGMLATAACAVSDKRDGHPLDEAIS